MNYRTTPTAIRKAFDNIKVKPSANTKEGHRIANIIVPDLLTNKGNVVTPDWNANLSFKTAKELNAPLYDTKSPLFHQRG